MRLSWKKGALHVQITVTQLAELVQGRVHGEERTIVAARPMNEAGPDDITFIESDRNVRHLKNCRARAALVSRRAGGSPPGAARLRRHPSDADRGRAIR